MFGYLNGVFALLELIAESHTHLPGFYSAFVDAVVVKLERPHCSAVTQVYQKKQLEHIVM
jgi:hypothetical protein